MLYHVTVQLLTSLFNTMQLIWKRIHKKEIGIHNNTWKLPILFLIVKVCKEEHRTYIYDFITPMRLLVSYWIHIKCCVFCASASGSGLRFFNIRIRIATFEISGSGLWFNKYNGWFSIYTPGLQCILVFSQCSLNSNDKWQICWFWHFNIFNIYIHTLNSPILYKYPLYRF